MFKDKKPEETPHLGIFLTLVDEGPDYDYLSFVIEKVAIIPFSRGEREPLVMAGYCVLPGATPRAPYTCYSMHHPYTWKPTHYSYNPSGTALPPGFDLDRLISHINRGITHFHGSYWPLPFKLSDADFEAAKPPDQWLRYMRLHPHGFQPVDRYNNLWEVFGVEKRDGTRVPLYDYSEELAKLPSDRDSSDSVLEALGKVDPTEFKKFLDDPERKLCVILR